MDAVFAVETAVTARFSRSATAKSASAANEKGRGDKKVLILSCYEYPLVHLLLTRQHE